MLAIDIKGGVILGHGVSTLSDYVRLSVKGKCPLSPHFPYQPCWAGRNQQ